MMGRFQTVFFLKSLLMPEDEKPVEPDPADEVSKSGGSWRVTLTRYMCVVLIINCSSKILLMFNFRAYGIRNCCKENQTNAPASLWGQNPTLVAQSQGAFCHLLLLNLNPDWHLPWALLNRRLARSRSTCTLAFASAAVTDFYCNLWVKTEAAISNANSEVPGPRVPFAKFLQIYHPFSSFLPCSVYGLKLCPIVGEQMYSAYLRDSVNFASLGQLQQAW